MHLRRALVLFAVVVGLAALVAGLSPRPKTETLVPPAPTAPPTAPPAAPTARLALDLTKEKHVRRHVPPGAHLILTVHVPEPGDVSFTGSVQAAEPHTPATFDILMPQSGSFEVEFVPSAGGPAHGATVTVSG
jgi:hypothetical protein